ncbi:SagB/ThcOx family dehydrogenase [Persephonella sp.]
MDIFSLPEPVFDSSFSVEKAILRRRSVRVFSNSPLNLSEISQLLWACQGITHFEGFRTAPSAGALYPLEVYFSTGNIKGIPDGIYRYDPFKHQIILIKYGDLRYMLYNASLNQEWVRDAPVCFIITGVYDRTTGKYGSRGIRYVDMEAGHAAQNLCLQATALEIGTVTVGAFFDSQVQQILGAPENEFPLYLIPAGKVR